MTRFRNILAVYNGTMGSEAVLEQAVAVANAQDARLTLLRHVGVGASSEEAHKQLRRIVPWVVQQGVAKIETAVTPDRACQEIIRRVTENAHDLVILSSQGGPGLKNAIFGDLGASLMRNCPCPVWVLRPEQAPPCSRILAAVGDDDGDPKSQAINGRIVGLGTALAQSHDAKLHIVHAWSPQGADAELLTNEIPDETREAILRRNEARHRCDINKLLAEFPVSALDHEIHLPRGLPQQEIVGLANRIDADVIVMGTTWRTGLPRFLLGNPARTVFGTVGCSIVAVNENGLNAASASQQQAQDDVGARLRAVGAR